MEYIQEFAVIQGSLLSLQKKLGVLKLLSHEQQEDKSNITVVVETLNATLNSFENLDSNDCMKLRQISIFLILNSDLRFNEMMVEDTSCGHLIHSAPTLSQDIIVQLMCEPLFYNFLLEFILFSPVCLVVEFVEIFTKYFERTTQISIHPSMLVMGKGVYGKLISLNNDNEKHDCALDCAARKLMMHFSKLLEIFVDSKRSHGEHLNNNLSEGLGIMLRSSLKLVESSLKLIFCLPCLTDEQLNIYKINPAFDYSIWHEDSKELFVNIMHDQLFSILLVQIAHVTVDIWLDWAELDSKFSANSSMQKDIAECMYMCHEAITSAQCKREINSNLLKSLLPMLESMAMKPRDEDDEIQDADISLILEKIPDNSCNQKKWLTALFKKFDVLSIDECIKCIQSNTELIDTEISFLFLQSIISFRNASSSQLSESIKKSFFTSLRQLPLTDQLCILNQYLQKCKINTYLCLQDYNTTLKKCLNTVVDAEDESQDKMYGEFVILCFQNPLDVLTSLIKHGIASDSQAQIMGDILLMLQPLHSLHANSADFPNVFVSVLYEIMENQKNIEFKDSSFNSLIVLLVSKHAISAKDYFKFCLLPLLHISLLEESWVNLNLYLQTFQALFDGTLTYESLNISGVLIIMAEIVEKGRRKFTTFSGLCITVVEKALNIIAAAVDIFLTEFKEDVTPMYVHKSLLTLLSPCNLIYFFDLWSIYNNYPEVTIDWKVHLIHGMCLTKWNIQTALSSDISESKHTILLDLIQLLPSSTQNEWRLITQNLFSILSSTPVLSSSKSVFEMLYHALQLIILMQSSPNLLEHERDCAMSCIKYCISNFAVMVKDEIVGKLHSISALDASSILQKIIHLHQLLPGCVQDSCAGLIINVEIDLISCAISDMLLYCNNEDDDETEVLKHNCEEVFKSMTLSLTLLQNSKTRQALATKLLEGFNMIFE